MKSLRNIRLLLLCCLSVVMYACTDEDENPDEGGIFDTVQEDKRTFDDGKVKYALASQAKLLSEYQESMLIGLEEDTVLLFSTDSKMERLPHPDEIYLSFDRTPILPSGLCGKVKSVEQGAGAYRVTFTYAPLDEIFDDLVVNTETSIGRLDMYDEKGNLIKREMEHITPAPTLRFGKAPVTKAAQAIQIEAKTLNLKTAYRNMVEIEGYCTVGGTVTIDIDKKKKYFNLTLNPYFKITAELSAAINAKLDYDDTECFLAGIPLATIAEIPFLTVNLNLHSYFTTEAGLGVQTEFGVEYSPKLSLNIEGSQAKLETDRGMSSKNPFQELQLNGNASIGIGVRTLIGINWWNHPIAEAKNLYTDAWGGMASGFSYTPEEDTEYELLYNTPFNLTAREGIYAKLDNGLFSDNLSINKSLTTTGVIHSFYLYPKITDWTSVFLDERSTNVSAALSRDMLMPVRVDMALFKDGERVCDYRNPEMYWIGALSNSTLQASFSNLEPGEYTAYPVVQVLGVGKGVIGEAGCSFKVEEVEDEEIEVTPGDLIDMGCSVLWASANIGASTPRNAGTHFPASEVHKTFEKNLRTPTLEEWKELLSRCDMELVGPYGQCTLLTSRETGNKLLFPNTGFYLSPNGKIHKPNGSFYWITDPENGCLYFADGSLDYMHKRREDYHPYIPIRGVREK